MSIFTAAERRWIEWIEQIDYCNPFIPERIDAERGALSADFDERYADWNRKPEWELSPNVHRIRERCEALLEKVRDRGGLGSTLSPRDRIRIDALLIFALYRRFRERAQENHWEKSTGNSKLFATLYDELAQRADNLLATGPARDAILSDLPHLFAIFFQLHRAFDNIFQYIHGISVPAVALRATVWQSIFSHDMRRYRTLLYPRMADYTTLIVGPSGTGKELVARAIGLSRYIPFDVRTRSFQGSAAESFYAVSLASLSPTLIESELFGHTRGSFTGAVRDRAGWFEVCPSHGTVFLDEIGDLDPALQVKLLRVLQDRTFSRIGETKTRPFHGKVVAATNRELATAMQAGSFRPDLYYRLCSDIVRTPSLRERLSSDANERQHLVAYLLSRIIGEDGPSLATTVENWIDEHLGADYPWPGNVRELEQCLRNVLIRGAYIPPRDGIPANHDRADQLAANMRDGTLTAEELLNQYCSLVYEQTGSYEASARRLGLDRRTVKARVHGAQDKIACQPKVSRNE